MNRSNVLISLVLSAGFVSMLTGCKSHSRRDVGRVQNTIGPGYSEIYPRTGVNPYQASVINGPLTTPTNVGQGARLDVASAGPPVGASVPVAPLNDGLPAAAIAPPSPLTPITPGPQTVPQAAAVAATVPMVAPPPQIVAPPAVAAIPYAVSPTLMAQPIPVTFATPATRSAFIPAGAVVAMPVAPQAVAMPTAPGAIQQQPVAPAAPQSRVPPFFSEQQQRLPNMNAGTPAPSSTPSTPPARRPAPTEPPIEAVPSSPGLTPRSPVDDEGPAPGASPAPLKQPEPPALDNDELKMPDESFLPPLAPN